MRGAPAMDAAIIRGLRLIGIKPAPRKSHLLMRQHNTNDAHFRHYYLMVINMFNVRRETLQPLMFTVAKDS